MAENATDCRCTECGTIHSEFIAVFGKWPSMTHEEGQALKRRREENEASWRAAGIGHDWGKR